MESNDLIIETNKLLREYLAVKADEKARMEASKAAMEEQRIALDELKKKANLPQLPELDDPNSKELGKAMSERKEKERQAALARNEEYQSAVLAELSRQSDLLTKIFERISL